MARLTGCVYPTLIRAVSSQPCSTQSAAEAFSSPLAARLPPSAATCPKPTCLRRRSSLTRGWCAFSTRCCCPASAWRRRASLLDEWRGYRDTWTCVGGSNPALTTAAEDRRLGFEGGIPVATCGQDAFALSAWEAGDPVLDERSISGCFVASEGHAALIVLSAPTRSRWSSRHARRSNLAVRRRSRSGASGRQAEPTRARGGRR